MFKTIDELVAAAREIELSAARRYREYASQADMSNPELAILFRRLAREEDKHGITVMSLAENAGLRPDATTVETGSSATSSAETPSMISGHIYRILSEAVDREVEAFEIYTTIAATSKDKQLCLYAEDLAREELGHAALLRALRRRYYPDYLEKMRQRFPFNPAVATTRQEFLECSLQLEECLAHQLRILDEQGINIGRCFDVSLANLKYLNECVQYSHDRRREPEDNCSVEIDRSNPVASVLELCDTIFEYYDQSILQSSDQDIMRDAIHLASQSLELMNRLYPLAGNTG